MHEAGAEDVYEHDHKHGYQNTSESYQFITPMPWIEQVDAIFLRGYDLKWLRLKPELSRVLTGFEEDLEELAGTVRGHIWRAVSLQVEILASYRTRESVKCHAIDIQHRDGFGIQTEACSTGLGDQRSPNDITERRKSYRTLGLLASHDELERYHEQVKGVVVCKPISAWKKKPKMQHREICSGRRISMARHERVSAASRDTFENNDLQDELGLAIPTGSHCRDEADHPEWYNLPSKPVQWSLGDVTVRLAFLANRTVVKFHRQPNI
ncbi:hypothetical protein HD553DRAFT_376 [Filobasidium floriforme]|uniref:uncharacterized protein n=1 Tax=Filobasidium floriforme TaxID=5210 RepID=UPI001E8DCC44|nr:uncharacterized protein HD553DRAFT_376 [Filobasidium floriforme]KAH8090281.1 hypothetical protein HD553DRAFT_376 [Filobasidium floriforme]